MRSSKPRKQRRFRFNAPLHRRRKMIASPLHPELRAKYGRRTLVIRKGDTVKVLVGDFKGHVGKVVTVHTRKGKIAVDKVTLTKADGKEVPRLIDPSNVMIVKLDMSDKWRKRCLDRKAKNAREEG